MLQRKFSSPSDRGLERSWPFLHTTNSTITATGTFVIILFYKENHPRILNFVLDNFVRDAVITSSINCLTSFLAGFVIFSVLGYMAKVQNKSIDKVGSEGI